MDMHEAKNGRMWIVKYPNVTPQSANFDQDAKHDTEPTVADADEQVLDVLHDDEKSIAGMDMLREMMNLGNITQEGYFEIAHKFEAAGSEGHAEIVISQSHIKTDQEYIDQGVEIRRSRQLQLSPNTDEVLAACREQQTETEQPEYLATVISTDVMACKVQGDAENLPELNALLAMALETKKLGPDENGYFGKLIPEGKDKMILWCSETFKFPEDKGTFALCVCLHRDGAVAIDSFSVTAPNTFAGVTPAKPGVAVRPSVDLVGNAR
jgi:hypothetical protein